LQAWDKESHGLADIPQDSGKAVGIPSWRSNLQLLEWAEQGKSVLTLEHFAVSPEAVLQKSAALIVLIL
jgi:hypothetical protein